MGSGFPNRWAFLTEENNLAEHFSLEIKMLESPKEGRSDDRNLQLSQVFIDPLLYTQHGVRCSRVEET